GEEWTHQAKLLAPDGVAGNRFGNSVAIYQDTIAVGAPSDDDNEIYCGSAHIFVQSGGEWKYQAMLLAPDRAADDYFGASVAIYGNTIVIGASRDDDNGGNRDARLMLWIQQRIMERRGAQEGVGWTLKPVMTLAPGAEEVRHLRQPHHRGGRGRLGGRVLHGPLERPLHPPRPPPQGEVQRPREEGHAGEVREGEHEDRRAAQPRPGPHRAEEGADLVPERRGRRRGVQDVVHAAQDQDRVDLATAGGAGAEEGEHPALDAPGREAAPAEGVVPHRVVRPGPQAEELGEGHGGPAPERLAVGRAADALHGTVADHGEAELAACRFPLCVPSSVVRPSPDPGGGQAGRPRGRPSQLKQERRHRCRRGACAGFRENPHPPQEEAPRDVDRERRGVMCAAVAPPVPRPRVPPPPPELVPEEQEEQVVVREAAEEEAAHVAHRNGLISSFLRILCEGLARLARPSSYLGKLGRPDLERIIMASESASPDDNADATALPQRPPSNVSAGSAQETAGGTDGTDVGHSTAVPDGLRDGMTASTVRASNDDGLPIPVRQVVDHGRESEGPRLHDGPPGPPCFPLEFDDSLAKGDAVGQEEVAGGPQLHDGLPGPPSFPHEFDDSLAKTVGKGFERMPPDHAGDYASAVHSTMGASVSSTAAVGPSMLEGAGGVRVSERGTAPPMSLLRAVATAAVGLMPSAGRSTILAEAYRVEEAEETPGGDIIYEAEPDIPPFYQRKGFLSVMIALPLLAVIAMGVLLSNNSGSPLPVPTSSPSEDPVTGQTASKFHVPSSAPSVPATLSPMYDPRPILTVVRERGSVRCGVEDTVATGAVQFGKFAADLCRSVAAAVLGDPYATQLVPVGKDRYQVLNDHGVDLLTGDAWTVEKAMREPTTGSAFNFGHPYYQASVVYVGVPNYVECAMSEKRYDDCGALAICAVDDSLDIRDAVTSYYSFLLFDKFPVIEAALHNGTCDVLVADDYQIYGSELQADLDNGTYVMSDLRLFLNRISMVTRTGNAGDQEWSDVLSGLFAGIFRATQIGLGLDPAACQKTLEDPRRGSGPISFLDPVNCVGNHFEIFSRSISTKLLGTKGFAKAIDAPNLGSLQCRDCKNVLMSSPTLREIVDRGGLRCGIYMDPERNYTKSSLPVLMAETYCTSVAATIFQGDPGAATITHFTEIDFSVFPVDFDVVAGVAGNLADLNMDGLQSFAYYDPKDPSPWRAAAGYFLEDKYYLNGVEYNGIGKELVLATRSYDEDDGLTRLIAMVFVATVHAQRIGVSRSNSQMMPLIELFGDAVTFMLKDVVALVGNYDDVLAESFRASDGQIEKGWNGVVQNFALTTRAPMLRCSLTGSCPPEELGTEIGPGIYMWDSSEIPDESELMVLENLGGWLSGNADDPFV
ncbi:hypothetical protein THAOC_22290, partial [Thalassiosira oceanica]